MADFNGNIDPPAEMADVPLMTVEAVLMGGIGGALNEQATALTARTKDLDRRANSLLVDSVAALRALPTPQLTAGRTITVDVLGYYSPGDGGGGAFYWQGNSNETDDEGLVFIPDSLPATGRWKRVYELGVVNLRWFGARGDGQPETSERAQMALDCGAKIIVVPDDASFVWNGNAPTIRSNTYIKSGGGVISQPNADAAATGITGTEYAGFRLDLGFENVVIDGLDLRGPSYQGTVTPAYRSIGISVSGRYDHYFYNNPNYPANPPVRPTGTSKNLTIINCKFDGWGQSAVIADQVAGFFARFNKIKNCCRDGIRMYGVTDFDVSYNDVERLGPGMPLEGIPPNNNMYGIEASRIYHCTDADGTLTDYPASRRGLIGFNKIRDVPGWKGAGTHGGTDIVFMGNEFDACHIAIGVDKGGFTAGDGYAPPRRISLLYNTARCADGDGAYGHRAAYFCVANDDTEQNIGEDLHLAGNKAFGPWGEDDRDGAFVVTNYRRMRCTDFTVDGALRAGVNLQSTVEDFNISGGTISNVLLTTLGMCAGISAQSGKQRGTIDNMTFIQPATADQMTAISTASPDAGYGVVVGRMQRFSGNIQKFNGSGAFLDPSSPYLNRKFAWANYVMAGGTTPTITVAKGVASLSLIATGQVRVAMAEAATASTSYAVSTTPRGTVACIVSVTQVSATEFDIYTFNAAGAAVNSAMFFEVTGY